MGKDKIKVDNWEEEASTMLNQGYRIITDNNNEQWWVLDEVSE